MSRTIQPLPPVWKFQIDQDDRGEQERWFARDFDHARWGDIAVPGAWDLRDEALWSYEGIAWYATEIPPGWAQPGAWQRLVFGRVNYQARVWLNGHFLGEHNNGYLPFEFAITQHLRAGQPNKLVVRVDNAPRDEWLPGGRVIEWVQYGGILQPVTLITTAPAYISGARIVATPSGPGADVTCSVEITHTGAGALSGEVGLSIGGQIVTADVTCAGRRVTSAQLVLHMADAGRWSPESPILHTANILLREAGDTVDEVKVRFGVRNIAVRGRQILLNGTPLRVKGVNRYDEYGGYGPVVPADVLRADLLRIKQSGANLVRVHYPHDPIELDIMDEIGLLAMEEVPLNWWGVDWWGPAPDNAGPVIDAAEQALADIVRRDKNHPCIIIWSMCNECATDKPAGIAAMRRLMARARQLDSTRLVTFVAAGDASKHPAFDQADIVCTNLYFGLFSEVRAQHIADMPALVTQPMRAHLAAVKDVFGDKPIVVTEFGAHGIHGLRGDARMSEDYQAAYIQAAWDGITALPEVAGGVLWCWADYYHRRDFFGKRKGDAMLQAPYGPYGVVTVDRREKISLAQLAQMYGARATHLGGASHVKA
jgi:beta-galactosidase/beta-glucuronidase